MGNVYSTVYGTARMLINPPPWKRLQHPTRIWMLGIDAAGKTTVMYQLSRRQFPHAEIVTTIPTIGFNLETVEFDRLSVTAFDMGGARKCQPLERERIRSYSDGIVWVIDCNDRDRLVETREELSEFVLKQEDLREGVTGREAMSIETVEQALLEPKSQYKNLCGDERPWVLWKVNARTGEGLEEAFEWLVKAVNARKGKTSTEAKEVKEVEHEKK